MNRCFLAFVFPVILMAGAGPFASAAEKGSADGIWTSEKLRGKGADDVGTTVFRADRRRLGKVLALAPMEDGGAAGREISLPQPDGSFRTFAICECEVMAPELARQFPEMKTYSGAATDGSGATVRLDTGPHGVHAMIIDGHEQTFIDPFAAGDQERVVATKRGDAKAPEGGWHCHAHREKSVAAEDAAPAPLQKTPPAVASRPSSGRQLRTYRLAVATTGEYTRFHGGTVAKGQAAVVTAINRVNGIYQRELSIRLQLVAGNRQLIYTSPSGDPYTNSSASALLSQNQRNIDRVIGPANYDVGHVFSTGGGGLASFGVVGVDGVKAEGETGLPRPVGDSFWVDYVSHEIGHQFGADHTFNGDSGSCAGNRSKEAAFEPGSGTTIMGYAGICGNDNVQRNGSPFFHFKSLDQITNYVDLAIPSVGRRRATGNTPPTVKAGRDRTIPANTKFFLRAFGNDPDGDRVRYSWEQMDLGPARDLRAGDDGSSPLFRSFNPSLSPVRFFPRSRDVIQNRATPAEMLPKMSRQMRFRVTARDLRSSGGGFGWDDMTVKVVNTGRPFRVTVPNQAGITWKAGASEIVRWDTARTNWSVIGTEFVDIRLSTNGGRSFPIVLASRVPNDGSHPVTVPGVSTRLARVRIGGSGNVFYDTSDRDFTITGSRGFVLRGGPYSRDLCRSEATTFRIGAAAFGGFKGPITLSVEDLPPGVRPAFSRNPILPGQASLLTLSAGPGVAAATRDIQINGNSGGIRGARKVELSVRTTVPSDFQQRVPASGARLVSVTPRFVWQRAAGASSYQVQISETGSDFSKALRTSTTLSSTSAFKLKPGTRYFWRVVALNGCGVKRSAVRIFTTAPAFTGRSVAVNSVIPDNREAGLESLVRVPQGGILSDLNVTLDIVHPYVGDLMVSLTHVDTGTKVNLIQFPGGGDCSGDDIDIVLDDSAGRPVDTSCADSKPAYPRKQTFRPSEPLSAFIGEEASGAWKLNVADIGPGDVGRLVSWRLIPKIARSRTPFQKWQLAQFGKAQLANSFVSGPDADPDGDGNPNSSEYFFGTNPLRKDGSRNRWTTGPDAAGTLGFLRYRRPALRYDAVETVEFSPDNRTWSEVAGKRFTSGPGYQVIENKVPRDSKTEGYFRFRISIQE